MLQKSLRKQGADSTADFWTLRRTEWTRSRVQLELCRKVRPAATPSERAIIAAYLNAGRLNSTSPSPLSLETFAETFLRQPSLTNNTVINMVKEPRNQ